MPCTAAPQTIIASDKRAWTSRRTCLPFNKLIRPAFLSFEKLRSPRRRHSSRSSATVCFLLRPPFFVEMLSVGVASPTCTDRGGNTTDILYTENVTQTTPGCSPGWPQQTESVSTRKRGEIKDGICFEEATVVVEELFDRSIFVDWCMQSAASSRAELLTVHPVEYDIPFDTPDTHLSSRNLDTKGSGRDHPPQGLASLWYRHKLPQACKLKRVPLWN